MTSARFSLPFSAVALALVLASPAGMAEPGRYVLKDVDGGFIRLDTETGAVSHCSSREELWRCEPVADAQAALQDEINRLADENAALEQRLADLEASDGAPGRDSKLQLPSDEDFDRLFGFFEKFMQRFIDFARSLNEDPGRET